MMPDFPAACHMLPATGHEGRAHPNESVTWLVAGGPRDYGGLPRRQPPRAESRAGSPGARPPGLWRGARPVRADGCPAWNRGGNPAPRPFRGSAGRPPAGPASAETMRAWIRPPLRRRRTRRRIEPARPCLGPPRCAAVQGFRGIRPGTPSPGSAPRRARRRARRPRTEPGACRLALRRTPVPVRAPTFMAPPALPRRGA